MNTNPFEILDLRLNSIEGLLIEINKGLPREASLGQKDIGGIEVATEETGLSSHSIYRLVSERKLPHSKRGGRLYFSRKALQKWIEEGKRKTT